MLHRGKERLRVYISLNLKLTTVQRTAPQGSPRTPATCIAATTPGLIVRILNSVFLNF